MARTENFLGFQDVDIFGFSGKWCGPVQNVHSDALTAAAADCVYCFKWFAGGSRSGQHDEKSKHGKEAGLLFVRSRVDGTSKDG